MKTARLMYLIPVLALVQNASAAFIAHEWGTFTSLQGSDGVPIEGLEIEDDPLPEFVHSRVTASKLTAINSLDDFPGFPPCEAPCRIVNAWSNPQCECPSQPPQRPEPRPVPPPLPPRPPIGKGFEFDPAPGTPFAVTQKMETPVLYLHSDRELDARVEVDFPGGVLGQYYPAPSKVLPEVGKAKSLANGHARFDVKVLDHEVPLPFVETSSIYAPSREVNANVLVNHEGEAERFIFYRGLGKFDTRLKVTSRGDALTLHDVGGAPSQLVVFLVYSDGARGSIRRVVSKFDTYHVTAEEVQQARTELLNEARFHQQAENFLAQALVDSGLYRDEAVAMVNTWKKSYFRTPGLRVLYLLSPGETEQLLPMRITPRPDEVVRTLVGRVEVLTDAEEQELLHLAQNMPVLHVVEKFGRFAEAKLIRLLQLSPDADTTGRILAALHEQQRHRSEVR